MTQKKNKYNVPKGFVQIKKSANPFRFLRPIVDEEKSHREHYEYQVALNNLENAFNKNKNMEEINKFEGNYGELEVIAGIIYDGYKDSKVEGLSGILWSYTPIETACRALTKLDYGLKKHKPAANILISIGEELYRKHREICDKKFLNEGDKKEFTLKLGYNSIKGLFDKRVLRLADDGIKEDQKFIRICNGSKERMAKVFTLVNQNPLNIPIPARPSLIKPIPFTKFSHPVIGNIVKTVNPKIEADFTYENMPLLFDSVNKHMETPYVVNVPVYNIFSVIRKEEELFLRTRKNLNNQQREGIAREEDGVFDIFSSVGSHKWWQYMNTAFRSRLYSNSVYASTQGSKLSKSLIKLARGEELGIEGWFRLLVAAATLDGTDGIDKASMDEKFDFAEAKLDTWMKWVEDPINYKEERVDKATGEIIMVRPWTEMDEPHCGLAALLEIKYALESDDKYKYVSNIILAIDATCSGLQHLSLLGRDEISGALCNVANTGVRGDYYTTIFEKLWAEMDHDQSKLPRLEALALELKPYQERVESLIEKIRNEEDKAKRYLLKKRLEKALNNRKWFYNEHKEEFDELAPVFWTQPKIIKKGRKIVKRPCMVYFYSCEAWTMGSQIFDDWSPDEDFAGLVPPFCQWLASRIYTACQETMKKPTEIMNLFIDMGMFEFAKKYEYTLDGVPQSTPQIIAKLNERFDGTTLTGKLTKSGNPAKKNKYVASLIDAYSMEPKYGIEHNKNYVSNGLDLCLTGPYNYFKFMQYYRKTERRRVKLHYRNERVRIQFDIGVGDSIKHTKVISASAPNIVHMMDAQLVSAMLIASIKGNYDLVTIHDSFGALPSQIGKVYEDVRQCTVDIYTPNVLQGFIDEIGYTNKDGSPYIFEPGNLDVRGVLDDEYYVS